MAREDDLLIAFLSDPIIQENYGYELEKEGIKGFTLNKGLKSEIPIVKTIAIIVSKYKNQNTMNKANDTKVYEELINYLNKSL